MNFRHKAAVDAPPETSGVKVIVVDDNSSHRQLAQTLLSALGCEVWLAQNGDEAVRLCEMVPFDIVLMDRHMPGSGGDAAAAAIRKSRGPSSRALIIAHSSDPPKGGAAAFYDRVIAKPIRIRDMLDIVTPSPRRAGRMPESRYG